MRAAKRERFGAQTGRVTYAQNLSDPTLNRSYDYDQVGRLVEAHTGNEADAHVAGQPFPPEPTGAYSQSYRYDVWGNMTTRVGWGGYDGTYTNWTLGYTNNRRAGVQSDAAGNLTDDGWAYEYDAASRQTHVSAPGGGYALAAAFDGDGLRTKKVDNGAPVYYLRSSVLGGQVVCELNGSAQWQRGYVYLGGQLLALQQAGVYWVAQDPVTKSQRLLVSNGTVSSTIDLDPWGAETDLSGSQWLQPHRYTTYERDGDSVDDAQARRYHVWLSRFDQPDPYDGSMQLTEPQSLNRYAYVQNDPVNFTDPSGLLPDRPRTIRPENPIPNYWWSQYLFGRWPTGRKPPYVVEPHERPETEKTVPDTVEGKGNPNCLQNAVPGSPGIGRPFAFNPSNGLVGHDGAHALSPAGGGKVQTLAPLTGQVIYTHRQEGQGTNALYLVDVRLANGDVARYKDLSGVSVRVGQNVGTGAIIGSVRPAGDPRNYVGLHLTLVNGANYAAYKNNVRGEQPSPVGFFIDPLGPNSPVGCPGVNLTR